MGSSRQRFGWLSLLSQRLIIAVWWMIGFCMAATAQAGTAVDEALFQALQRGDESAVQAALQKGAYINARLEIESNIDNVFQTGFQRGPSNFTRVLTPLAAAVESNDPQQLDRLLALGANLKTRVLVSDYRENFDFDLLQYALFTKSDKVVAWLRQQEFVIQPEDVYLLVLGEALYADLLAEVVTRLSTEPAQLNVEDAGLNMNGVFAAIITKNQPALELLLKAGADPQHVNTRDYTPLQVALAVGNREALQTLLSYGAAFNFAFANKAESDEPDEHAGHHHGGEYTRSDEDLLRTYYETSFAEGDIEAVEWMNDFLLTNYAASPNTESAVNTATNPAMGITPEQVDSLNLAAGMRAIEYDASGLNIGKTFAFLIALNNQQFGNNKEKARINTQLLSVAMANDQTAVVNQLIASDIDPYVGDPSPIVVAMQKEQFGLLKRFLTKPPTDEAALMRFVYAMTDAHEDDSDNGPVRHYANLETLLKAVATSATNAPAVSSSANPTVSPPAVSQPSYTNQTHQPQGWAVGQLQSSIQLPKEIWACYLLKEMTALAVDGFAQAEGLQSNTATADEFPLMQAAGVSTEGVNPWDCLYNVEDEKAKAEVGDETLEAYGAYSALSNNKTLTAGLMVAILTMRDRQRALQLLRDAPQGSVEMTLIRDDLDYDLRREIESQYPRLDFYYDDVKWLDLAAAHYQHDVAMALQNTSPPTVTAQQWLDAAVANDNSALVIGLMNLDSSLALPEGYGEKLYASIISHSVGSGTIELPAWFAKLNIAPPEKITLPSNSGFLGCSSSECEVPLLIYAVDVGAIGLVKELLESAVKNGTSANKPTHNYATAIFHARSQPMIDLLQTHGYNLNDYDSPGDYEENPLSIAIVKNDLDRVKTFLAAGANPNLSFYTNEHWGRSTPLSYAVAKGQPEIVNALLAYHVDINALLYPDDPQSCEQTIPIMQAMHGEPSKAVIEKLVAAGADLNYKNACGNTVFNQAERHHDEAFLQWLTMLAEPAADSQPDVEMLDVEQEG